MAYKRLVVERNAFLVWFGVIGLVLWFAFIRAEGVKTLGDIIRTLANEAHALVWIAAPVALCTYCAFVGLGLRWWRDLRVDRENRRIKTDRGAVLTFDQIGALSVTRQGLVADGVTQPLYRGSRPQLRRDALDHVLGRFGRVQLLQLRRLSFHRSWRLLAGALLGCAVVTLVVVNNIVIGGSTELEYILMAVVAYGLCIEAFVLALFGSFSRDQPFVDPIAGVVRLQGGSLARFDELGALSIEHEVVQSRTNLRHVRYARYKLRGATITSPIDEHYDEIRVRRNLAALEAAVLQHTLRRVFEMPAVDGAAFRGGLDPAQEVARLAGDSPHRRRAIEALTHDPDPTIRERAKQLL